MNKIIINKEFLPVRCEICHQTDLFDIQNSYCKRCKHMYLKGVMTDKKGKMLLAKSIVAAISETAIGGCLGLFTGAITNIFTSAILIELAFKVNLLEKFELVFLAITYVIGLVVLEGSGKQVLKASKPVILFLIVGIAIGKGYDLLLGIDYYPFITNRVFYCALLLPALYRLVALILKFKEKFLIPQKSVYYNQQRA
jgi:hypothetical protein